MEIRFSGSDIRGAQRFGDVGITSDGHASVIKRTFGQWAIHCLKYYNPFGGYRNRIKEQRNQIYNQLIQNKGDSALGNVTRIRTGSRKMLLRELSELLPNQEEAAEYQTNQSTGHLSAANRGQAGELSAQTSVGRWGDPQTAVASIGDEKFHGSGIEKLSNSTKEQYKTALCHEMKVRIENKIATLRPEWGTAAKDTENAARKEAAVAFLIMDFAKAGIFTELQPLITHGQFEESRFSAFEQLKETAGDLDLCVPTNFSVDVACQLVEKLEFKNGELTTSPENLDTIMQSATSINFRRQTSDVQGVKFRLPEGTSYTEANRFLSTADSFYNFMREDQP